MNNTVYFRAFEPEDAELIYKWMNDDELKKAEIIYLCRSEYLLDRSCRKQTSDYEHRDRSAK
jgi:hypothetical protein